MCLNTLKFPHTMLNRREFSLQEALEAAPKILNLLSEDQTLPESLKLDTITHVTALTCALIAVQPIPFADIFILTPIQVAMIGAMSKVMGDPLGKDSSTEIAAAVIGVVGWGVLAQQVILAGYKTVIPFLGGVTTIPLVYAATFGLCHASRAVLAARRRDQTISKEEIERIQRAAEKRAKDEQSNLNKATILAHGVTLV